MLTYTVPCGHRRYRPVWTHTGYRVDTYSTSWTHTVPCGHIWYPYCVDTYGIVWTHTVPCAHIRYGFRVDTYGTVWTHTVSCHTHGTVWIQTVPYVLISLVPQLCLRCELVSSVPALTYPNSRVCVLQIVEICLETVFAVTGIGRRITDMIKGN
jgi:hypothetical protein